MIHILGALDYKTHCSFLRKLKAFTCALWSSQVKFTAKHSPLIFPLANQENRNNAMYTHHKNSGRKKVQYPPVETPDIFAFTLVLVKTCFITIKIEWPTLPTMLNGDVYVCDW